jgi:putative phage-type endonuclease
MKENNAPQGSEEWYRLRLGRPTASQFHRIIQPKKLKMSASHLRYVHQLVCERILGRPMDDQISHVEQVERGKAMEPTAIRDFEFAEQILTRPAGFCMDDDERWGCSPDRFLVNGNETLEIKCPKNPVNHMWYLLQGPEDIEGRYFTQVQGQMFICGGQRAHFYSWHPDMPPKYHVIERDNDFIAALEHNLQNFLKILGDAEARARDLGHYSDPMFVMPLDRAYPEVDDTSMFGVEQ